MSSLSASRFLTFLILCLPLGCGGVAEVDRSPSPDFVSSPAGMTVRVDGEPNASGLVLVSSNLPAAGNDQEWFAEVRNDGSRTLCQVMVDLHVMDGRFETAALRSYVMAEPYLRSDMPSPLMIQCIAPGKIGLIHAHAFVPSVAAVKKATTLRIAFTPMQEGPAIPAPQTPNVISTRVSDDAGYGVEGTITGQASPIYDVRVGVFVRDDARGVIVRELEAFSGDTLSPSEVHTFASDRTKAPFTTYRSYVDFVDGSAPLARAPR